VGALQRFVWTCATVPDCESTTIACLQW